MKRVFENLGELENFLKDEKDFIHKLIFYKLDEAFETEEEVRVMEFYSKDVVISIQLTLNKDRLLPCLEKLEEYFVTVEEYEKCQKILEYKKLLKLGF